MQVRVSMLIKKYVPMFITLFILFYIGFYTAYCFGDTFVTTYVTRVQEERRDTRWTLTEWLRIKERMKLMDVWLAMFSDPQKDRFSPELNVVYAKSKGTLAYAAGKNAGEDADVSATQIKGQLWLTNIFTGSTGRKFLNIDFGLEGYLRQSITAKDETADETTMFANPLGNRNQYFTGNFRIFGKHIQDSSLALKVGQYKSQNQILGNANEKYLFSGVVSGAELQLYIFRFLGLEANYLQFHNAQSEKNGETVKAEGNYYDYGAYVEIALFRFMGGYCHENWVYKSEAGDAHSNEKSLYLGLKLQI